MITKTGPKLAQKVDELYYTSVLVTIHNMGGLHNQTREALEAEIAELQSAYPTICAKLIANLPLVLNRAKLDARNAHNALWD